MRKWTGLTLALVALTNMMMAADSQTDPALTFTASSLSYGGLPKDLKRIRFASGAKADEVVPSWGFDGRWIYFFRNDGSPSKKVGTVAAHVQGSIIESANGKYLGYYLLPPDFKQSSADDEGFGEAEAVRFVVTDSEGTEIWHSEKGVSEDYFALSNEGTGIAFGSSLESGSTSVSVTFTNIHGSVRDTTILGRLAGEEPDQPYHLSFSGDGRRCLLSCADAPFLALYALDGRSVWKRTGYFERRQKRESIVGVKLSESGTVSYVDLAFEGGRQIRAIDSTGTELWSRDFLDSGNGGMDIVGVMHDDSGILVADANDLLMLAASDGGARWKHPYGQNRKGQGRKDWEIVRGPALVLQGPAPAIAFESHISAWDGKKAGRDNSDFQVDVIDQQGRTIKTVTSVGPGELQMVQDGFLMWTGNKVMKYSLRQAQGDSK